MAITRIGSETLVNTRLDFRQDDVSIGVQADGSYLIAWESETEQFNDLRVAGRRFNADGVALGAEFEISVATAADQKNASVAVLSDGVTVVVWEDQSGDFAQIRGRRIVDGVAQPGDFLVNAPADAGRSQGDPSITALAGGGYVVSWDDLVEDFDDAATTRLQVFDAAGAAVGDPILANTDTDGFQIYTDITALSGGGFVVTWQDGLDFDGSAIEMRVYGADFLPVGTEVRVDMATQLDQLQPVVAGLADGGFVLAWSNGVLGEFDQVERGIVAQRFDAGGARIGGEFVVAAASANFQGQPAIAALSDGGFAVAWSDDGQIRAKTYDAAGAVSDEVVVTVRDDVRDSLPAIEAVPGGFVVSWTSLSFDTGETEVLTQLFSTFDPAPSDIVLADASLVENAAAGSLVATAVGTDRRDVLSYALTDDAGGRFVIDAQSGVIRVAAGAIIDFETTPLVSIGVSVTDLAGQSYTERFDLAVVDVVETLPRATYDGGAAADTFTGAAGFRWTISGLGGNDTLSGAGGDDTIFGGRGNDTMFGRGGDDVFYVTRSEGVDAFDGGTGVDAIIATGGSFNLGVSSIAGIEQIAIAGRIVGTSAANVFDFSSTALTGVTAIDGGSGADTIVGSSGDDVVLGGAGNDQLSGGAGADVLSGGTGIDRLTGGTGADLFSGTALTLKGDTIDDFGSGDGIEISDYANPGRVVLSYNGTLLFIDGDGAGGSAAISIAIGAGYASDRFQVSSSGLGGTLITYDDAAGRTAGVVRGMTQGVEASFDHGVYGVSDLGVVVHIA